MPRSGRRGPPLILLVLLACWPLQAEVCFDFGSGLALLQLLVVGAIGLAYWFRAWLSRSIQAIEAFFRR